MFPLNITFTQSDLDQADSYVSNGKCLLACALLRNGFQDVMVFGCGTAICFYEGKMFSIEPDKTTPFNADTVCYPKSLEYDPSKVLGLQITLVEESVQGAV